MATYDVLYLDGVKVATPAENGISRSVNKTWSENSGRTSAGKAVGTIKYIKKKLEITWGKLSASELKKIEDVVNDKDKPFKEVKYREVDGKMQTIICYFGDSVVPIYRYKDGKAGATGYKISAIEQ